MCSYEALSYELPEKSQPLAKTQRSKEKSFSKKVWQDVWLFAGKAEDKAGEKKNEGTKNAAFFVPSGVHFLGKQAEWLPFG